MKAMPLMAEMARSPQQFEQILVHTGQHYDHEMSEIFFEDLQMPPPEEFLGIGSGTHAEQTARIMLAFEPVLLRHGPDLVIVAGDVNSTLACALGSAKCGIPVAHVEAGLRSFDRTMPEELNRLLTDHLAEFLFTPSEEASRNLLREGIPSSKIHFVGNVMIDCLVQVLPKAEDRPLLSELGLSKRGYILATLHRPSNVDHAETLAEILSALECLGNKVPVVLPLHPRTRERIQDCGLSLNGRIQVTPPLGYIDFLCLEKNARLVITDSGGIQEETTYMGVPCLTLRPNTERPITLEAGTNRLVMSRQEEIVVAAELCLTLPRKKVNIPKLWDGAAARRILSVLSNGCRESIAGKLSL